ncbi:MAG: ATP-dependent metallopeptidase FtsH/Yme1/Tma family protein [Alphaproteobacteria bacterium]|nr:ATP-dependent metallopeptidase FtsH/Yme1/Tma family protein [Alphaproteobacteria bacterium]
MNNTTRNLFLWAAIGAILFVIFQMFPGSSTRQITPPIAYSQFMNDVTDNKVEEVTISGHNILGRTKDGRTFITYAPENPATVTKLLEKNVLIRAVPPEQEVSLFHLILPWLPILLLAGLTFYSFRQIQSGGNKAMGFGKSRARLMGEKTTKVTFEDVAGIDEAKQELQEVVDFLKDPQKFQRLGGKIPRGVLLVGPPGTGKTLLARAIAGEAEVPFFSISGSDFVEMFVGVGASRVRDMFEQAKKNSPCIIFIDEIDAVGRHRGAGLGGGNDEREQTLNQLLVEMDGFEENQGVILVAATNRPDILDPALLRPGRFDRQVVVPNPDVIGREKILKVHMRKLPLAPNVDARTIARGTPGFSGADLANLVNEAALLAARKGKLAVGMHEFEQAKDKVLMGAERRSMVMTDDEKRLTAYHEGGHAIVSYYTPESDPIHKATIIPRGRALGMVMRLPEGDRISLSRSKLLGDLKVAMGGRIAEEMIFGPEKVTTGASSDIKMATDIAFRMITEWGMSKKLGFQTYGSQQGEVFLGYSMGQNKTFSEATSKIIDEEVRSILDECYEIARKLLEEKIDKLHILAKSLLERETLTGDEIRILLEGGTLPELALLNDSGDGPRMSVPIAGGSSASSPNLKPV